MTVCFERCLLKGHCQVLFPAIGPFILLVFCDHSYVLSGTHWKGICTPHSFWSSRLIRPVVLGPSEATAAAAPWEPALPPHIQHLAGSPAGCLMGPAGGCRQCGGVSEEWRAPSEPWEGCVSYVWRFSQTRGVPWLKQVRALWEVGKEGWGGSQG